MTNRIPLEKYFKFMDSIDLETNNGKSNFVTKYSDKITEDFNRMGDEGEETKG